MSDVPDLESIRAELAVLIYNLRPLVPAHTLEAAFPPEGRLLPDADLAHAMGRLCTVLLLELSSVHASLHHAGVPNLEPDGTLRDLSTRVESLRRAALIAIAEAWEAGRTGVQRPGPDARCDEEQFLSDALVEVN
jgi:hypothetical protein